MKNASSPSSQNWRMKYESVINSPQWKAKKKRLIQDRGRKCEHCGCEAAILHLHHKDYRRLGNEPDADLQLVCVKCHPIVDKIRAVNGRLRRRKARVRGYARRRYGGDWENYMDEETAYSEWENSE